LGSEDVLLHPTNWKVINAVKAASVRKFFIVDRLFSENNGQRFLRAQVMLLNKGKFYELNVKHRF
jgi:hypothetical protein